MAGIHGLLQLMGGRHYLKINKLSSSQLRGQEQQEPDAKEQGTGLILLFCPAGCQGRVFGRGGTVLCLQQNRQEDPWCPESVLSPLHHTAVPVHIG